MSPHNRSSSRMLARWFAVAAVALGAIALEAATADAQQPAQNSRRQPNIIFILADDLGYGDVGCYGQKQVATPNLDRMASEGVRFTQFYTGTPVCAPARNNLMTGEHSGHSLLRGNAKIDLRPQDITIAEVLKSAGYTTGAIGKWGLGKLGSEGAPRRKGFDYFFGFVDQTMAHNYYPHYLVRNETRVPLRNVVPNPGPYDEGVATEKVDYSADIIAEDALTFIRDNRDRPFFLYFAPTLPHANDEAMPDGMEIPDYGQYAQKNWPTPMKGFAAMVTRLDQHVGRILTELKRLNIDENTIVMFTSDNGPHQEGGYDPTFFDSNGELRGIKRDLYEGGIREPMIVRWPGRAPAGVTSSFIGYFPDVLATAADLAGAKLPRKTDGVSFVPAILGKDQAVAARDYLYWEFYERDLTIQAVRMGKWKAVRKPMHTGPVELYDLSKDIGEQNDVAAGNPEIVERAKAYMKEAHTPSSHWPLKRR